MVVEEELAGEREGDLSRGRGDLENVALQLGEELVEGEGESWEERLRQRVTELNPQNMGETR